MMSPVAASRKISIPPPAFWLALAAGLALRLYHYLRLPELWHDEAATILNLIGKSFGELLGPLYLSATGPPLILALEKCFVLLLGDNLYALRLFSFLASCAGLLLFARVARALLAPFAALCAVLLVACSDRLLWHAAEARHYSSDFLLAVVLLAILHRTSEWPPSRRAFLFCAVAPLVIFSAYPGVFLGGGLFLALALSLRPEKDGLAAALLAGTIALSFLVFYFFTIRVQRSAAMDSAWVHAFPDWHRFWTLPLWAVRSTLGVFDYIGRPLGVLLLFPAALGLVHLCRTRRAELALFAVAPMVLAMIAALGKAYPYTGARTMVFAMPSLVLLAGGGIEALHSRPPATRRRGRMAFALAVLPLAATIVLAGYRVVVPWPRPATGAASAYVLAHWQEGDRVIANHWEYEYHFRSLGDKFTTDLRALEKAPPPARVWLVLTSHDLPSRDALVAAVLGPRKMIERREFPGATVVLAAPE